MPNYKSYNGVQYDMDLDYTAEIQKAAASGNNARAAVLENQRNAKIAGEGLGYSQTNDYAAYLPEKTGVAYDLSTDYMAKMNEAAARGDYTGAYNYEQQRNAKIVGEGLDTETTHTYDRYNPDTRYKYDPSGDAEYQEYRSQMQALYDKIMGHSDFEYDTESDPLYRQYRDQYIAQGRQAMRDTMGQAAALTGGYGSTYAQQAGEQAYAAYLGRLNDVVPELYGAAYDRWRGERNDLMAGYELAGANANNAYERGYNAWSTRLGLERQDEDTAYSRRQAEEQTAYNRQQNEAATARSNMENERAHLLSVISASGYIPTDAELQEAGMTRAEAEALRQAYLTQLQSFNSGKGRSGSGGSGRRSGGSRRSSGGGGGTVQPSDTQFNAEEAIAQLWNQYENTITPMSSNQFSGLQRQITAYLQNGDVGKAADLIAQNQKNMTEEQYNALYRLLLQAGG